MDQAISHAAEASITESLHEGSADKTGGEDCK